MTVSVSHWIDLSVYCLLIGVCNKYILALKRAFGCFGE